MTKTIHITTFYSYKGGVGRTMLLANVGAILARKGRKVLLWDLDLEAPGMQSIPALRPARRQKGFLEWLLDLRRRHPPATPDQTDMKALSKIITKTPVGDHLKILPAFGEKSDSAGLYQDIDWHEFMVENPSWGLDLFRTILEHFSKEGDFDHILLDARTGITDLGGIMTALLPHATVLVGSYGSQNLSGLLRIHKALQPAVDGKITARTEFPPLKRLIVVSPVPDDQEKRRDARKAVWDKEFSIDGVDNAMETKIEIPFDSRLLFTEDLLSLSTPDSPTVRAYELVAGKIDGLLDDLVRLREKIETEEITYPEKRDGGGKGAYRSIKGVSFVARVTRLLTLLGYKVEEEQLVDGNRVDLVAQTKTGLRSESYIVNCKNLEKPLGKKILKTLSTRLNGVQAKAMRAEGMVVARSFSRAALDFAKVDKTVLCLTLEDLEKRLIDFGPYLARLRREFEESELFRVYVEQRVLLGDHSKKRKGVDLLPHAKKWADGEGNRLWILTGDDGVGKTSFFKRFSYELAKESDHTDSPIPIAVDLKEFPNALSLENLLQEHLRVYANWHGNPEIILYLLATGRVVLLLDAFDEMGASAADKSVEAQFRQLATPSARADNRRGNRVLITCRTRFIRDQQSEKDKYRGKGDLLSSRDVALGGLARKFNASMDELMLFNDKQINCFLSNHLSDAHAEQAKKFIQNTYDLPGLAPTPAFLEMIVKALPALIKTKGELTAVRLYHIYTHQWIEDKSGRSLQTSPDQRKWILEYLAFILWGGPRNRIHQGKLTSTLEKTDPKRLTGMDLDRVAFELGAAAFITRTPDGYYSFSHKSFLEFFFARYLSGAIRRGPDALASAFDTAPITPGCAAFLSDLIDETREDGENEDRHILEKLKTSVRAILDAPYRQRITENTLRLAHEWSKSHGKHELLC